MKVHAHIHIAILGQARADHSSSVCGAYLARTMRPRMQVRKSLACIRARYLNAAP